MNFNTSNNYLITFSFFNPVTKSLEIANIEIEASGICSMEEIESMQVEIAKKYKLPSVTIINWNKFEKPL